MSASAPRRSEGSAPRTDTGQPRGRGSSRDRCCGNPAAPNGNPAAPNTVAPVSVAVDRAGVDSTGRGPGWLRAARYACWLAWASLVWMTVEGVIGLVAGFSAGSVSLVGWALGSAIEGLASVIVVWRFTGARTLSETAEGRAQKAVAVSFWLLAPYIALEAVRDLLDGHHAQTTTLGIALTAASLIVMPALGIAKHRLGARLGSGATAGEGTQNLMCAAQAGAVLLALAVSAVWPAGWWVDPVIALGIAGWSAWEGVSSWRGDDCC